MLYYLYVLVVTVLLLDSSSLVIVGVSAQQPIPSSLSTSNYKAANRIIFDWIDDNGIRRTANISDMIEPYGLLRNLNNRTRISNPFLRFPYINTIGKKFITVTTIYRSSSLSSNSSIITTKRQNITFNVIDSRCSNELIENSDMSLSYIGYWKASPGTTLLDITSVYGQARNAIRQSVMPTRMPSLFSRIGSWLVSLFSLGSRKSVETSSLSSTSTVLTTSTSSVTSASLSDGLMYMKNISLSCLLPGTSWNIIARIGLLSSGKNTGTGMMCQISTRTTCPIIIISFFGGIDNKMLFYHIADTYELNQWTRNQWNVLKSTMIIPRLPSFSNTTTTTMIGSIRIVITSYNGTTTTIPGTDYVLDSFSITPKL